MAETTAIPAAPVAMTAPAVELEGRLAAVLHVRSEAIVLGLLFVAALVAVPAGMLVSAAAATRVFTGEKASPLHLVVQRYAFGLVPLGFSVWLAHYGFHLLTGMLTIVPVSQSAAIDLLGSAVLGAPLWQWTGMSPGSVPRGPSPARTRGSPAGCSRRCRARRAARRRR